MVNRVKGKISHAVIFFRLFSPYFAVTLQGEDTDSIAGYSGSGSTSSDFVAWFGHSSWNEGVSKLYCSAFSQLNIVIQTYLYLSVYWFKSRFEFSNVLIFALSV